jgi:hypothetical protein
LGSGRYQNRNGVGILKCKICQKLVPYADGCLQSKPCEWLQEQEKRQDSCLITVVAKK